MMIELRNPLDMHLHLREGEMLESTIGFSARAFSAALAMPNLKNPITTTKLALKYQNDINNTLKKQNLQSFCPIMSLYITDLLDKDELVSAKNAGIKILKLYPKGATTGSESGISKILDKKTLEIFELAQNLGFILSIHGESNGFSLEREFEFGEIFKIIAKKFPKLQIIIEHISDRRSIDLIERYDNLFATLTLHHITMDLDSVLGKGLNPHCFCKPILKTPQDREALLQIALKAHSKVSFGSDSAPHLQSAKLRENGSAGIFSSPILLPRLCEIFEANNKLENLQAFISDNAIRNYNLENIPQKCVRLRKKESKIAESIPCGNDMIIPLMAGESISWSIESCDIKQEI